MKANFSILASAAAASLLVFPVLAAEQDIDKRDISRPSPRSYDRSHRSELERLGTTAKANEILGMTIKNRQDEKIGKVDELAVDLEAGRIVQVIVSSGGVLGIGDKTFAVPPRAFSRDADQKVLRLDIDKEKLNGAPAFETSKWEVYSDTNRVVEIYRYYGQEPYFVAGQPVPGDSRLPRNYTSSSTLGQVEKASKLIGMTVKNKQDEKVGKVDNLMVDLENGRIVHVIVSSGGFLGIGDALSAVPPSTFHYDTAQRILHLDTTKEALAAAPHFKSNEWPSLDDPGYAGEVYSAYHVEPYFNPKADADNTARNVRDRQNARPTPLDQGSGASDIATTRLIRKEIIDQKGLSLNARNIKVITSNGKVTLRGPVKNEEERRILAEIAGRAAPGAIVDNQLEVKRDLN